MNIFKFSLRIEVIVQSNKRTKEPVENSTASTKWFQTPIGKKYSFSGNVGAGFLEVILSYFPKLQKLHQMHCFFNLETWARKTEKHSPVIGISLSQVIYFPTRTKTPYIPSIHSCNFFRCASMIHRWPTMGFELLPSARGHWWSILVLNISVIEQLKWCNMFVNKYWYKVSKPWVCLASLREAIVKRNSWLF